MHRTEGRSAREVEKEQLVEVRAAWASIANRHLAAHAAATGVAAQAIDHRSNKDRGLEEQPTVHEGGVGLIGHADKVKLNEEIKARNERLRVLRSELKNEGYMPEQLETGARRTRAQARAHRERETRPRPGQAPRAPRQAPPHGHGHSRRGGGGAAACGRGGR